MVTPKQCGNENGIAMVVTLLFLLFTMFTAGIINRAAIQEMIFSSNEARGKAALAMAEAGARDGIRWLLSQGAPPTSLAKISGNSAFYAAARSYAGGAGFNPPTTDSGWSPYVSLDNYRYRYYVEDLPSDFASSGEQGGSIKVGNKYDDAAGNQYHNYRITSVGSTMDGRIKKCVELNYAVKF